TRGPDARPGRPGREAPRPPDGDERPRIHLHHEPRDLRPRRLDRRHRVALLGRLLLAARRRRLAWDPRRQGAALRARERRSAERIARLTTRLTHFRGPA